MPVFNPAQFKSAGADNPVYDIQRNCWAGGGQHTRETYPPNHGWRAKPSYKGSHVLIIGKPGEKGCASVMDLRDGRVDVAFYFENTPKEVVTAMAPNNDEDVGHLVDRYLQLPNMSGWGLRVVNMLKNMLEVHKSE